ncbi:MAG: ORF6N domain-containing protein [Bacteroidales bacterium]|nr:ORF6N domain-containing protein [Bacteroidales bacterium]
MAKEKKKGESFPVSIRDVEGKIAVIRNQEVIADADIADLYGVETREVNQAVRNNPDKFPEDYMFVLTKNELHDLKSKILISKVSKNNHRGTKVFTEKGLYMLATVLKGKRALAVAFAIIETFAMVRNLKRELLKLHSETDKDKQTSMIKHYGEVLSDIVMPVRHTTSSIAPELTKRHFASR